jgi:hypothetical protein
VNAADPFQETENFCVFMISSQIVDEFFQVPIRGESISQINCNFRCFVDRGVFWHACGLSSTPQLLGSFTGVSGILDRPTDLPGRADYDSCYAHRSPLLAERTLANTDVD